MLQTLLVGGGFTNPASGGPGVTNPASGGCIIIIILIAIKL